MQITYESAGLALHGCRFVLATGMLCSRHRRQANGGARQALTLQPCARGKIQCKFNQMH